MSPHAQDSNEHPAVTRFREYLRIDTRQPTPDYAGSTEFLIRQAKEIDMPYRVVEVIVLHHPFFLFHFFFLHS
jgi:aminoacylase